MGTHGDKQFFPRIDVIHYREYAEKEKLDQVSKLTVSVDNINPNPKSGN